MKKLALIFGLLLLVLSCGGKKEGSGDGKEVTLRFSWWGGDERHEKTLEVIKLFEEKNPGVKIKPEYSGWSGHYEKITTQMAGGTAADVIQVNHNWLDAFSKDGNGFYDLNTFKDILHLSNFSQDELAKTTINGKLNMIPIGITAKEFYYNADTFKKAGIEIPKTWEEVFQAGKVFKEKLGNDYYPMQANAEYAFQIMLYYLEQKTGKPFINESKQIGYTEEEILDGIKFYQRLVDEHVLLPLDVKLGAGNVALNEDVNWINGKYAGIYEWDSSVAKYQGTLADGQQLVLATYPTLENAAKQNAALVKVTMGFAINNKTKNAEVAAKFIDFLLNDPEAVKILGLSRGIPLSTEAEKVLKESDMLKGIGYEGYMEMSAKKGFGLSTLVEHSKFKELYNTTFEELAYKKITAEQAAGKFVTEGNEILASITK